MITVVVSVGSGTDWTCGAKVLKHTPFSKRDFCGRQSFAGAGIWHPDAPTLYKVRSAIVSRPEAWRKVKQAGLRIEGESLKKPPSGFDPTHPFIEDLKLKDLTAGVHFTDAQVIGPRFMKDFIQAGKMLNPLNKFLADALGVPW